MPLETEDLNPEAVNYALQQVISDLDYDLHKEIVQPEDDEDEDQYSYEDLTEMFTEAYFRFVEAKNGH